MLARPARAFTLIELLIVVAIIAILAAIAVPNFLEAQVRAKVSRARADLRSIATAIEAYRIDYNNYAPNDGGFYVTPVELTTPIAYMTSRPSDPFTSGKNLSGVQGFGSMFDNVDELFTYWHIVSFAEAFANQTRNGSPLVIDDSGPSPFGGNRRAAAKYGTWAQFSVGPDASLHNPAVMDLAYSGTLGTPTQAPWGYSFDIPYDATNGTVSQGNIARTQMNPERSMQVPVP